MTRDDLPLELVTNHPTVVILALFTDSWLFSATSSVLQFGGFDLNTDAHACTAASYVCVIGYFISKV